MSPLLALSGHEDGVYRPPAGRTRLSCDRRFGRHCLTDLKPLKFRIVEIERAGLVVASAGMRGAKLFRFCPCLEGGFALPHRVRSIESVIFRLRTPQQMEFDKARDAVEIGLAGLPNLFEGFFRAAFHAKPIHCDEHLSSPGGLRIHSSCTSCPAAAPRRQ